MKRQKDIAVIASSGIILIAFFFPWFKAGLLDAKGASVSGYDLMNFLFNISSSPELSKVPKGIYILFLLGFYPLCSAGLLYNEFRQKPGNLNFAKVIVFIVTLLFIGGLFYAQNKLSHGFLRINVFGLLGFGMYLTIAASIGLFITLFRKPVMIANDDPKLNCSEDNQNQESTPKVQAAPISSTIEQVKETPPIEEKIGTNYNKTNKSKTKTSMIIGISAFVVVLGIILLYVFVFKKRSSVRAEEKAKIEQIKKDSLVKDSIEKANLVFDEKIILGTWEGPFDKGNMQLCITSIKNKQAEGYNVYKKNKRSISGSVENKGDTYHLVLEEPGDLKGDGVFTFDINKSDGEIIGSWKMLDGKLLREYRLTKQGENKTEQIASDAKTLTIEGTNVNIRNTPSTKGAIVVQLNSGTACEILDKGKMETIKGKTDYWYKIRNNGKEGWVFGSFTSLKQ